MWGPVKQFFAANAVKLLGVASLVASFMGAFLAAYGAGKRAEKVEALKKDLQSAEKANEIKNKNKSELRDGDAAKRLRERW